MALLDKVRTWTVFSLTAHFTVAAGGNQAGVDLAISVLLQHIFHKMMILKPQKNKKDSRLNDFVVSPIHITL